MVSVLWSIMVLEELKSFERIFYMISFDRHSMAVDQIYGMMPVVALMAD